MATTREERAATPEERALMRAYAGEQGTTVRRPRAWSRKWATALAMLPLLYILGGAVLLFLFSPLWIAFQAIQPFCDPAWWLWAEGWVFRGGGLLVALGVPAIVIREGRKDQALLNADAFPGERVEVWSVRGATAAYHQPRTWGCGQGRPDGTGDSLYFDLEDGGVFCLSGDEWRAFAQGGALPDSLRMEGPFPSDAFDVVVMPHCRRAIRVVGRGSPLPLREYERGSTRPDWELADARDRRLGCHFRPAGQRGQAGVFHPDCRPWAEEPPAPLVPPSATEPAGATVDRRKATEEEQERMRERARTCGATPRAPGTWLLRLGRTCWEWILPFYVFLLLGYAVMLLVGFVAVLAGWLPKRGLGTGFDWIRWWAIPGLALAAAGIHYWRWSRRVYRPIRLDAFSNNEVEVWTVRTYGAAHLLRGGFEEEFLPPRQGSCCYFELDGGRVLAVEGMDWVALARGRPPEGVEVAGVFPSEVFELVVAPRSRWVVRAKGSGQPLPFREWVDRYGDEARVHRQFRQDRDALRHHRQRVGEVAILETSVRPWNEPVAVFRPEADSGPTIS